MGLCTPAMPDHHIGSRSQIESCKLSIKRGPKHMAQQNEPEEYYYVDARTGVECWHYVDPGAGIKCWIAPPQHQIHLLLNVLADRLADADKLVRELELHKSASGKKQLQLQMIEHYAAELYFELKHIRETITEVWPSPGNVGWGKPIDG
jgi:hypothetical protein